MEGMPSGMDFIRSSILDESTPDDFIISSRDGLVEGASASAPPRGTMKDSRRFVPVARNGAEASAFALPANRSYPLGGVEKVGELRG